MKVLLSVVVTVSLFALLNNSSVIKRKNGGEDYVGYEEQDMQDYYNQFDQRGRFVDGTVVVSPDEADEMGITSGLGWVN